jgi:hypothetical protein
MFRTRSRCPRAMERDWDGLQRRSSVVRPWILMYPRRMALRRVVLEGEPRAPRDVGSKGGVFKIGDGRDGGVD